MKRTVLLALGLSLLSIQAHAISRYNSTSMSCDQVKARLANEGAAILRWRSKSNPNLPLYGRFVANGGYCESGTRAARSYVPTTDRKSCPVWECKYYDPDDDDLFLFRR